jgi:hypothetical protein
LTAAGGLNLRPFDLNNRHFLKEQSEPKKHGENIAMSGWHAGKHCCLMDPLMSVPGYPWFKLNLII